MPRIVTFFVIVLLCASAVGQKPVAQLPSSSVNTTWAPPVGGTTWAAHNATQFASALKAAQPGDVIVLDAGVIYSGNFQVPAKSQGTPKKWIYIQSSNLSKLPAAGVRVSPANAVNMPKIVTPNGLDLSPERLHTGGLLRLCHRRHRGQLPLSVADSRPHHL